MDRHVDRDDVRLPREGAAVRRRAGWWLAFASALVLVVLVALPTADSVTHVAPFDIDVYPARTAVTACADPLVGKPAVTAFRAMILSQVGGSDDGLAACKEIANDSGSLSDHADGRAWDWHMLASRQADRARVERVLDWLLRTDERGHRNAMARRIGVTYIIWNHQYYRVGGDDARWVPYTSTADPHDTHVHFSFSVDGAEARTSWWVARGPYVWQRFGATDVPLGYGAGPAQPVVGDWNGDDRDTLALYDPTTRRFSLRNTATTGPAEVVTPPIGPFGAWPVAADLDGDGRDEVGVFDPVLRRFFFADGTSPLLTVSGEVPLVGDLDGDGRDDLGAFDVSTRTASLALPDNAVRQVVGGDHEVPVVGDMDGDAQDDLGVWSVIDRTFTLHGSGGTVHSERLGAVRDLPLMGDWDGDGIATPAVLHNAAAGG